LAGCAWHILLIRVLRMKCTIGRVEGFAVWAVAGLCPLRWQRVQAADEHVPAMDEHVLAMDGHFYAVDGHVQATSKLRTDTSSANTLMARLIIKRVPFILTIGENYKNGGQLQIKNVCLMNISKIEVHELLYSSSSNPSSEAPCWYLWGLWLFLVGLPRWGLVASNPSSSHSRCPSSMCTGSSPPSEAPGELVIGTGRPLLLLPVLALLPCPLPVPVIPLPLPLPLPPPLPLACAVVSPRCWESWALFSFNLRLFTALSRAPSLSRSNWRKT